MTELTSERWAEIQAALAAPFPPQDVHWRVQVPPLPVAGKSCQVLAYLDARDVQDRLDKVVGIGGWSFDWSPVVTDAKGLLVAKGTLTILGISKGDVGDASKWEGTKSTVSDCFKRAAVLWGIGRYLYSLPAVWVTLDANAEISAESLRDLQARLARKFPLPVAA